MKKIIALTLLAGSIAFAQDSSTEGAFATPTEKAKESVSEPADGTIAKPTAKQKKTIKKAAKKAEKAADQTTDENDPLKKKVNSPEAEAKKLAPTEAAPELKDSEITPVPVYPDYVVEESPEKAKPKKELMKDGVTTVSAENEGHLFGLHADVNIPHILNYGVDYWHSSKLFSVAANFGGYKVNGVGKNSDLPDGANIKISNQELVARYHPFAGSFYLGLGFGKHEISADANRHVTVTTPIAGSADVFIDDKVKANYLLPHVGWLWKTSFGLTFGMDLGYLSPSSSTVDVSTRITNISNVLITEDDVKATDEYKNAYNELVDNSEKIGKMGLPYWTVIRIGYMF